MGVYCLLMVGRFLFTLALIDVEHNEYTNGFVAQDGVDSWFC